MAGLFSGLAVLFIAVLPLLYALIQYNGLVGLRNHIRESWSNVDTELKRRYELIPNLVATVRGYAAHEQAVLDEVTALRARCAANHGSVTSQSVDESQLVAGLSRLFVVAENYPDLKANENFLSLQAELTNTEDRIQAARRFYNANVRDYRNKCESFPSSLVASLFSFGPESFFQVDSSDRRLPSVRRSDLGS